MKNDDSIVRIRSTADEIENNLRAYKHGRRNLELVLPWTYGFNFEFAVGKLHSPDKLRFVCQMFYDNSELRYYCSIRSNHESLDRMSDGRIALRYFHADQSAEYEYRLDEIHAQHECMPGAKGTCFCVRLILVGSDRMFR